METSTLTNDDGVRPRRIKFSAVEKPASGSEDIGAEGEILEHASTNRFLRRYFAGFFL